MESEAALRASWRARPGGMALYKNAKLANVVFAAELHARLGPGGVLVNAVSPGFVPNTGLSRHQGVRGRLFMRWVMPLLPLPFIATIDDGADALLHVCLSPDIQSGGKYFAKGMEAAPSPDAACPRLRAALWQLSEAAVAPFL